jgi:hypothetical protein
MAMSLAQFRSTVKRAVVASPMGDFRLPYAALDR